MLTVGVCTCLYEYHLPPSAKLSMNGKFDRRRQVVFATESHEPMSKVSAREGLSKANCDDRFC